MLLQGSAHDSYGNNFSLQYFKYYRKSGLEPKAKTDDDGDG